MFEDTTATVQKSKNYPKLYFLKKNLLRKQVFGMLESSISAIKAELEEESHISSATSSKVHFFSVHKSINNKEESERIHF